MVKPWFVFLALCDSNYRLLVPVGQKHPSAARRVALLLRSQPMPSGQHFRVVAAPSTQLQPHTLHIDQGEHWAPPRDRGPETMWGRQFDAMEDTFIERCFAFVRPEEVVQ